MSSNTLFSRIIAGSFLSIVMSCQMVASVIGVDSITLSEDNIKISEGNWHDIEVMVSPAVSEDTFISTSSSDCSIAEGYCYLETNSQTTICTIEARKIGKATITFSIGSKTASCNVTVGKKVSSIKLEHESIKLAIGKSETLNILFSPENAVIDFPLIWESTNTDVATVDNGEITAIATGRTYIRASYDNLHTDYCEVLVIQPVNEIKLDKQILNLKKYESRRVEATITPENATEKDVTWSTSDESVATVSDGIIRAVGGGTATITAQAGDAQASCLVNVTVDVRSIHLNPNILTLSKGNSRELTATIYPSDATDQTVIWKSSEPNIVSVDDSGMITAINAGEAIISASCGEETAKCEVTVTIPVSSIILNKSSVTLSKDSKFELVATILPEDATATLEDIKWVSSNESVVSVHNGTAYANTAGTATIKASIGDIYAYCNVSVVIPATSISFNYPGLLGSKGTSMFPFWADIKVIPSDTTDKITWKSSDPSIVVVDDTGNGDFLKSGTAIITATAGEHSASCTVTVRTEMSGGTEKTEEEPWN